MIAALATLAGTVYSANQAKKRAKEQMAFQREMSNTAVQRQMQDMQNAGINPILAGKYGGASSPTGSMAQTPNFGEAILRGAQIQQAVNTAKKLGTENAIANQSLKQEIMNTKMYNKTGLSPVEAKHTFLNIMGSEGYKKTKEAVSGVESSAKSLMDTLRTINNKRKMRKFLDKKKQTYKGKKYYDDAIMRGMRK